MQNRQEKIKFVIYVIEITILLIKLKNLSGIFLLNDEQDFLNLLIIKKQKTTLIFENTMYFFN